MKINFNPCFNYNNDSSSSKNSSKLERSPKTDEFVKRINSSPSFGSSEESFLDALLHLTSSITDLFESVKNHFEYKMCEEEIEILLSVFDKNKNFVMQPSRRSQKIRDFVYEINGFTKPEFTAKLFEDAKIQTLAQVSVFNDEYIRAKKQSPALKNKAAEAVKIYGSLNNKRHLSQYPELLLFLYNRSNEPEYKGKDDINSYPDFLKNIGIGNEKEFVEQYSHLASSFNEFKNTGDIIDCIDYIKETYPEKIRLIDEIISSNPNLKGYDSKKVYENTRDIVDYLFEQSSNQSLLNFGDIIEVAAKQNKLSEKTKTALKDLVDFSDTREKIDFFDTLSQCKIDISELNELAKATIASDVNLIDTILDKSEIIARIKEIKNLNNSQAQSYYAKYKELLYIGYQTDLSGEGSITDGIKTVINFIDKTNLQNENSFLQKYASIKGIKEIKSPKGKKNKKTSAGPKKGELTQKEIREFMDLFLFADDDKKDKTSIEELQKRKEAFLAAKETIESYLKENDNIQFAGQNAFEIYRKIEDIADLSAENIPDILDNIANFDIKNGEEYEQTSSEFEGVKSVFSNSKTAVNFLKNNEIKLDIQDENKTFRLMCLKFAQSLYKEENEEERDYYLKKLSESDFLKKSKGSIEKFLTKWEDKADLGALTKIMLDMNINSLSAFDKFLSKYADSKGEIGNLVKHMRSCPDMSFDEYKEKIQYFQNEFSNKGIEILIDNSNIEYLPVEKQNKKMTTGGFLLLAKNLLHVKEGNFIAGLKETYKGEAVKYSKYGAAEEIAKMTAQNNGSYKNILRELNIAPEKYKMTNGFDYKEYAALMAKDIPDDFMEFINSDGLLIRNNENEFPSLDIHARLRILERFILNEKGSVNKLHSSETKEKIKNLFNLLYNTSPYSVSKTKEGTTKRFNCEYQTKDGQRIKAVFTCRGQLLTVIKED